MHGFCLSLNGCDCSKKGNRSRPGKCPPARQRPGQARWPRALILYLPISLYGTSSPTLPNLLLIYLVASFPSFTYYVTTLSCTIGRRSLPNGSIDAVPVHVDIDLGPLKSVSRLHARIEYDEESDSFVICILGRNGAWVDGVWAKSGSRVPLGTR